MIDSRLFYSATTKHTHSLPTQPVYVRSLDPCNKFYLSVPHYTDTHLYVFSSLVLPLLIHKLSVCSKQCYYRLSVSIV
jgi:hypothetical protein